MEAVGIRSPGKSIGRIKFVRACRYLAGALTLAGTLSLAGCYGPPTQRDALMGGAIGAGGGALIGSAVDHPIAGALVGGAAGAGAGYLYGQNQENQWRYRYGGY
jgi:osmotically inducible lipoprotein OsmB